MQREGVPSCVRLRAGLMPASGPPAREGAEIETLDGQVVGTVLAPADTTDPSAGHSTGDDEMARILILSQSKLVSSCQEHWVGVQQVRVHAHTVYLHKSYSF